MRLALYLPRSYQGWLTRMGGDSPNDEQGGVGQSVSRDPDGNRIHNHKTTHNYRTLQ